jgi:hypothetical protein
MMTRAAFSPISSLRCRVDENLGGEIEDVLRAGQLSSVEVISTTLINAIQELEGRFLLILDDFQVIQDRFILQVLEKLVANLHRLLLGSMWLARRGKLVGLLCWPGALLYVLYSCITNLIDVPFGVLFLPYLFLVALSAYTTIGPVASIDGEAVRQRLTGIVPAKAAGGILVGLTSLFIAINAANIVAALTSRTVDALDLMPVWVADFTAIIPTGLVGGLLLWRRDPLGYIGGAGLLLQYSLLFTGVIACLVFPAFYNASPIDVTGIVLLLVWDVMSFVPFVLFVRGTVRS